MTEYQNISIYSISKLKCSFEDKIIFIAFSNLRKRKQINAFLKPEIQQELFKLSRIKKFVKLNNVDELMKVSTEFKFNKFYRIEETKSCEFKNGLSDLPIFSPKDYTFLLNEYNKITHEKQIDKTNDAAVKTSPQLDAMLDFSKFKKQSKKTKVAEHATPTPAPPPQDIQADIHLMAMTILEKLQPVLLNAIYTELMEHKK